MNFDILNSNNLKSILQEYRNVKLAKQKASFNLFTISSYTNHIENFHSDIIATLLNKEGDHKENDWFLKQFITYLYNLPHVNIIKQDFKNACVMREQGRLDIWIKDEASRKAIIIENKINNAPDMDDQLDRYFHYSKNLQGYDVELIIYLSIDGLKFAPKTSLGIDHLVRNIGAFTGSSDDLVSGWLFNCLDDRISEDSYSFIYQYISLLKTLSSKNMENDLMEKFYQLFSDEKIHEDIHNLMQMKGSLHSYRADRFAKLIGEHYAPFKKKLKYKSNYYLFEKYVVKWQLLEAGCLV